MAPVQNQTQTPTTPGALRQLLVEHGYLLPTPTRGLPAFSGAFEDIVHGFAGLAGSALAPLEATAVRFPALVAQPTLEASGYVSSFPDLIGTVAVAPPQDADRRQLCQTVKAGGDWTAHLRPAGLGFVSAACHSLYGALRGQTVAPGTAYDVTGSCFRHEPSDDPIRMITFRQREKVFFGTADEVAEQRTAMRESAHALLTGLGLPISVDIATDPFTGQGSRLLAASQRRYELKHEFTIPLYAGRDPVAVGSSNLHLNHYGAQFAITMPDGSTATSTCCGFGLERVAIALIHTHGPDLATWPGPVRAALHLTA